MNISRREFISLVSSAAAILASPKLRAQPMRVRREIRTLSVADVDVLRTGVAAMKALPNTDLRSWLYQAGVHGAPFADAFGVPDAATYWNQCVHGGPHFVSWHRWELLFIEEIIRLMSDQCSFTLPYWDYIANGSLPEPLRLPADSSNPLFDATRNSALNDGTGSLSGLNTNALGENQFDSFSSGLYGNPHSAVHGQVGGDMGVVPTAARDPVFYLHHCNIDRYWECWISAGNGRTNPGSPWPEQTFPFRTLSGRRDVIVGDGARTADLGYTYDNLPCGGPTIRPDILALLRGLRYIRVRTRPPRPIPDPWPWSSVAAFEPFVLDGRPAAVVLSRRELIRMNLNSAFGKSGSRAAVVLQEVGMSQTARDGGFFFEVWFVPSVRALRARKLEGAEQIGSFSTFDVSEHTVNRAGEHAVPHTISLELSARSQSALLAGSDDAVVLFLRRGLVDKSGKPLPFNEKAELLRVTALSIEVGR